MAPLKPNWPQPSHSKLLEVVHGSSLDSFTSYSRSNISAPAGSVIATLASPPLSLSNKAYSTVQISRTQHIELNCDFLYLNHSCDPSLELHIVPRTRSNDETLDVEGTARDVPVAIEVRVANRKSSTGDTYDLNVGDAMTFFYPSTEWEMAQPFDCTCGSKMCRGQISGAKDMPIHNLEGYFLNHHIKEMLAEEKVQK